MDSLAEYSQFLKPNQRLDLKSVSLSHILGLTGTTEGKQCILESNTIVESLLLLTDDISASIVKDAILCLINLTAEDNHGIKVYNCTKNMEPNFNIVEKAVSSILDENSEHADPWTMLLSNLTRIENLVLDIIFELEKGDKIITRLIKAFTQLDYNKKKCKLHYLGPIFCNLTQTKQGREIICTSKQNLLQKILPFASFQESLIRRGGTIGIIKNICFDPIYHDRILNDSDDILYCLLYPLIGPEEYNEDENDKFPIELQYMNETKTREEDPDLRIMLLESLLQLCAMKKHREFLRSKGTYEILREYHKWEEKSGQDRKALLMCENVVDILIKKEDEIGLENYKDVEVPEHITSKFVEDDEKFILDQ